MNKQLQNCATRTTCRCNPTRYTSPSLFSKFNFLNHFLLVMMVLFWQQAFSGKVIITTDVTWDNVLDVPTDANEFGITIQNGATLTIDGIGILFYPDADVFVYLGSTLVLNNAELGLFNPTTNTYWKGINATDPNPCDIWPEQYSTFPVHTTLDNIPAWEGVLNRASGTASPGLIKMTDSKIERAKTGISSKCGFIIRARGSEFVDCETGCLIWGYESTLSPHINASYFMDCTFKWTNPNTYFSQTDLVGLKLLGIKGINIGGCTFKNDNSSTTCPNARGIGISSFNSEFILSMSGNTFCKDNASYECSNNCYATGTAGRTSQRNIFTKLYRGIYSNMGEFEQNPATGVVIRNSDFTNNFNSIYLEEGMIKILDCIFTGNRTSLDGLFTIGACYSSTSTITDLELVQNIYGYEVYDCDFTFTGKDVTHIKATGNNYSYSRLQYNTFTNNNSTTIATDNVTGMLFVRENSQTEIKCNTFTAMGTDMQVGGSNTIRATQGILSGVGAGNKFSAQRLGRFRLNNASGATITYYYDGNPSLGNNLNPLTETFTLGAMGLALGLAGSIPEGANCQIQCMNFISSIKSVNFVKESFNILPQPANNEMKVVLINNLRHYTYYFIYNIQGKMIANKLIEDMDNIIINTSELNNGMYVLRLIDNKNQSIAKKLLIQH